MSKEGESNQKIPAVTWMALFVALAAVFFTADVVAQEEPTTTSAFTCPMHPQVRMPEKGPCSLCGMELIPAPPQLKGMEIPEGRLRAFCEVYTEKGLRGEGSGHPLGIISALVHLRGEESAETLRALLNGGDEKWLHAVAFYLGELGDKYSVPVLKKRLGTTDVYHCDDHAEVASPKPAMCPKCDAPLLLSDSKRPTKISIAGALHRLGEEDGLDALAEIVEMPAGHRAYSALAFRDTPEVRRILAVGTASDNHTRRAFAIAGQLLLGIDDNLSDAVRILRASDTADPILIYALGQSGLESAVEPLRRILRDRNLPRVERVRAALGLVKLGENRHLNFIIDAFHKMTEDGDRFIVYDALGRVGDDRVLSLLKKAIEEDPSYRSIAVAAAAQVLSRSMTNTKEK